MVLICNNTFSQNEYFKEHFQKFPFELSDFQKYAIKAIVEGGFGPVGSVSPPGALQQSTKNSSGKSFGI